MDFLEFQDEVIRTRFDASERDRIKRWLNIRYQWIWNQAKWSFKRVEAANLAIVGADATPTMPTDLAKVLRVYDDQGSELRSLDPNEWEAQALPSSVVSQSSTRADTFTVIDRQLHLSPTPGASLTYKLSYERRLSHVDSSLGVVGGIMVEDTDQPLWPAEHDYLLVIDAVILGQQLRNDPTWTMLVEQRNELLTQMKRDLSYDVDEQFAKWGDFWSPC